MTTRTLVTGGCGFIGSHIVARLVEDGDEVNVLDDLTTGHYENLPRSPQVTFHLGSVLDPDAVRLAALGVDRIIHLASMVGVRLVSANQAAAFRVSVEGTSTVLAATRGQPVVVFSSSAVYPDVPDRVHQETDSLTLDAALTYDGGQPGYACGKLRLEEMAAEESRKGRRVLIVRPFNVVGTGQVSAYGMVVPSFIANAQAGHPIRIYDDGAQTRTFGEVGVFVDCLFRLMRQDSAWLPPNNVFNIGSTESVSVQHLADVVRKLTGTAVSFQYVPYESVFPGRCDVRSRVPDTGRVEALLGPIAWPSIEDIVRGLCAGSLVRAS